MSTDVRKELEQELENLKEILNAQLMNKTLTSAYFAEITSIIRHAQLELSKTDPTDQEWSDIIDKVGSARAKLVEGLNQNPSSRIWVSLYAVQVWLGLAVIGMWFFYALLTGWPHLVLPLGVSSQVIIWGLAGGTVYSVYTLRNYIWNYQFSNAYGIYYLAYPFSGAIFGSGFAYVAQAGLLAYGTPSPNSPAVLFAVAFLAGYFQDWAVTLLQSVADAIHPSKGS
jgi:hypothetical protein